MLNRMLLVVATSLVAAGWFVPDFTHADRKVAAAPTVPAAKFAVLELFTSEGCSSCPPADRLLRRISEQRDKIEGDVFVLSWHVDYWNYLGWSDPFSSKLATQRQRRYAQRLGTSVFTPQLIVNGRESAVGSKSSEVTAAFKQGIQPRRGSLSASIESLQEESVVVSVGHQDAPVGAKILVCLVQKSGQVDVRRGENSGRRLDHVNIVRGVQQASATAEAGTLKVELQLPKGLTAENAAIVVLLEDRSSHRLLAAAETSLLPQRVR